VSHDPSFKSERGLLPNPLARAGPWANHDVVVCRSPDMPRTTVNRLTAICVPADRMTYDVVGDEHPAAAQVIDLRSRAARQTR